LRKSCTFRFRKPPEHQTDLTKIEIFHGILSLKQLAQRKNIEGCKKQIPYIGKSIKITAEFSTGTLKARRAWSEGY
jgi:hypothetical protein